MKAKKTIIHVSQPRIRQNIHKCDADKEPVLIVIQGSKRQYAHRVRICGPSEIVSNEGQLSCSARCWIETFANVQLDEEITPKNV